MKEMWAITSIKSFKKKHDTHLTSPVYNIFPNWKAFSCRINRRWAFPASAGVLHNYPHPSSHTLTGKEASLSFPNVTHSGTISLLHSFLACTKIIPTTHRLAEGVWGMSRWQDQRALRLLTSVVNCLPPRF